MGYVFRMQVLFGKRQREHNLRGLAKAGKPCRAAGSEQTQKNAELQRRDEFARGGKVAFVACLLQAPLRCLLCLALIRHGPS